jgi:hypothetical protein
MIESDAEQTPAVEQTPARSEDQAINTDQRPDPFWDLKASHWATVLLTCALVGVGIAQYRVYSRQAEIMNGQQEVMQNQLKEAQLEQRAWVSIASPSIRGMSSDSNGIRIELAFALKNSGRNPAVNSFVSVEASADRRPDKVWQSAVCGKTVDDFGFGVFPGDQLETEISTYIGEVANVVRRFPSGVELISPFVVACVVYKDAVTQKWHHTPYAFKLQMKAAKPSRSCCAIFLKDLPLNADELILPVWPAAMSPD